MSRIEKQPVVMPEAVEANIVDSENLLRVKGPKGELSLDLINDVSLGPFTFNRLSESTIFASTASGISTGCFSILDIL